MDVKILKPALLAGWAGSLIGAFQAGRARSWGDEASHYELAPRTLPARPAEHPTDPPAIELPAASSLTEGPVAAERSEVGDVTEAEFLRRRVSKLEAQVEEMQQDAEEFGRLWMEDLDELRRLRRANGYLITELGPYRKTSISLRPAFLELKDPSRQFRPEALRSCLIDFVAGQPLELSDGEIVALAPVVAQYYGDRSNLQEEDRRIDRDPSLTPEERERRSAEIRMRKYETWQNFREKLVEILGEDRATMFE